MPGVVFSAQAQIEGGDEIGKIAEIISILPLISGWVGHREGVDPVMFHGVLVEQCPGNFTAGDDQRPLRQSL